MTNARTPDGARPRCGCRPTAAPTVGTAILRVRPADRSARPFEGEAEEGVLEGGLFEAEVVRRHATRHERGADVREHRPVPDDLDLDTEGMDLARAGELLEEGERTEEA